MDCCCQVIHCFHHHGVAPFHIVIVSIVYHHQASLSIVVVKYCHCCECDYCMVAVGVGIVASLLAVWCKPRWVKNL